ncbi:MAG: permease prefix domain 1-containing protein [Pyrinomonadaceae bacterium]
MKGAMGRLLRRFGNEETTREIDEELRFHLELLTRSYLQQGMSPAEAREAAVRRFGNVERIKGKCLAISRRHQPFVVALKSFLVFMFLAGIWVRMRSTDLDTRHLGGLLIAVPILSRLFLYVRDLNPSTSLSKPETVSPLRLNEDAQPLFKSYDQGMLTPVERLISDK